MRYSIGLTIVFILAWSLLFSGCVGPGDEGGAGDLTPQITETPEVVTSSPLPTEPPESSVRVKVTDAVSGAPLNGLMIYEKGAVHSNRFSIGAVVKNGEATIVLPKVRDIPRSDWNYWGMHVYATDYIYFPQEIRIEPGADFDFEVTLAKDQNPEDDPVISDIQFEREGGNTIIKLNINSPRGVLGPQNLALNSKTGEALVLQPPTPVAQLSDNFPNGIYTATYPDPDTDPKDWYFVVADHGCSNGPIQGYPVNANILPALSEGFQPVETEAPAGTAEEIGAQLVTQLGCQNCHFFDKESTFEGKDARIGWRIGPGMKGLYTRDKLPFSGRPVTDENIKTQIRQGGIGMPAFPSVTDEEISNIIAYLKSI